MSVYIDNAMIPFRRMKMSHMMADTTEELLEVAERVGLAPRWIQRQGTAWEHFDVSMSVRAKALLDGAVEVTCRQAAYMLLRRQQTGSLGDPGDAERWFKEERRR